MSDSPTDIETTARALKGITNAEAEFGYVWRDVESAFWAHSFFMGNRPRDLTEPVGDSEDMPDRVGCSSYILMRSGVAYQSLRAIDILNALQADRNLPYITTKLDELVPILKPYIPKLSPD